MTGYTQAVDIANRALQILELPRISTLADVGPNSAEINFVYDKLRRSLLRKHLWRFATRRACLRPLATTTVLLQPAAWAAGTYNAGAIVNYQGILYSAVVEAASGVPGVPGSGWEQYFGPLTVTPWNVPSPSPSSVTDANPYLPNNLAGIGATPYGQGQGSTGYYAGELVYLPKGDGTQLTFRSTVTTAASPQAANDGPLAADPWDAATTYGAGDIVSWPASGLFTSGISAPDDGSVLGPGIYQSTVDLNTGNQPDMVAAGAALTWSATNAYSVGDNAWGSDNQVYACLVANTGQNPVTDTLFAYWTPLTMWVGTWSDVITPTPRAISNGWQYIAGSVTTMAITYPLTAGPIQDCTTRNAFRLPANYIREAPQSPKLGGIGYLGAPSGGLWFNDREYEGNYIITSQTTPILYRFVADITDVTQMDDLFCEALAGEVAAAVQPSLQPARDDLFTRAKMVRDSAIDEAQTINGIEIGYTEPPVDRYISCRL